MATASIFEDVKIKTAAQAEAFITALESSALDSRPFEKGTKRVVSFPDETLLQKLAQQKFCAK